MKNEIERIEEAAFGGPIATPDAHVQELEPSEGVFPCPEGDDDDCKTADWLKSRERAGLVFLYLDTIAPEKRTSDQENDLGIALAWEEDWEGAAQAFKEAMNKASDAERQRVAQNLRVAERSGPRRDG